LLLLNSAKFGLVILFLEGEGVSENIPNLFLIGDI
jgi:hypothetical protein